jgi:D-glycero-alpha-D-manno-heptose-7-phosphate kinase
MCPVIVRAPTRIDFGGGWTDVPPYSTTEGGRVCNVAINRCAEVRLTKLPSSGGDHVMDADSALATAAMRRAALTGVQATIHSDFPTGAGLGGSSAVGVAIAGAIRAWRNQPLDDRARIAEESRAVEVEEAGIPGGRQDHYAAAFGGALDLVFGRETVVRPLTLGPDVQREIESRCLVFYTGQSRVSGNTITAVLDAYARREPGLLHRLERLKTLAGAMAEALAGGDLDALGGLVDEHWNHQRALHRAIPTPLIDEVLAVARRSGALGGKALGASGGGCVVVIARSGASDAIRAAVARLAQPLDFAVDLGGVRVHATEAAA